MNVFSLYLYLSVNLYIYERCVHSSSSTQLQQVNKEQDNLVVWRFWDVSESTKYLTLFMRCKSKNTSVHKYICTCGSMSFWLFASSSSPEHQVKKKRERKRSSFPSTTPRERQKQRQREREAALLPHHWECLTDADSSFP